MSIVIRPLHPLFAGDTLYTETEIVAVRPSSKPEPG